MYNKINNWYREPLVQADKPLREAMTQSTDGSPGLIGLKTTHRGTKLERGKVLYMEYTNIHPYSKNDNGPSEGIF